MLHIIKTLGVGGDTGEGGGEEPSGDFPNLPEGFTHILTYDGGSLGGLITHIGSNVSADTDATAPDSPSAVRGFHFNDVTLNVSNQFSTGSIEATFGANYSALYVYRSHFLGAGYLSGSIGNKSMFLYPTSGGNLYNNCLNSGSNGFLFNPSPAFDHDDGRFTSGEFFSQVFTPLPSTDPEDLIQVDEWSTSEIIVDCRGAAGSQIYRSFHNGLPYWARTDLSWAGVTWMGASLDWYHNGPGSLFVPDNHTTNYADRWTIYGVLA